MSVRVFFNMGDVLVCMKQSQMSAFMLVKMIFLKNSDNTRHRCVDRWFQTVGSCAVDEMRIMPDGVKKDMRK
jgi:hypothetical protein